ncbi:MAG: aminotransferase class III-fold pyridoxal phosphate-dependent enzyme [Saprospiraceae bacterium]
MQKTDFQNISIEQAEKIALHYYAIKAEAKKLDGEVDFNFFLKSENGQLYTLKISRPSTQEEELIFQANLMEHLKKKNLPFQVPELIPAPDGSLYKKIRNEQNQEVWIRLQKWVAGKMLDEVNPRTPKILTQWGKTAGQFSLALQDFDHPAAHRFYKWNPSETLFSKKFQQYIYGEEEKEIAAHFWNLFETETQSKLNQLRKSVNYNDAHEHNLLVNDDLLNPEISGVIDFGDALFSHTINELAIACAYACMHFLNPLEAATHVIKGFHKVFPLEEKEIEVLYSLISARLMITVANAAWNKHKEPDNKYLLISENPAWDLLKKWRNISPALAHYTFRSACGWSPCSKENVFKSWLGNQRENFAPVINWVEKKTIPIDLSVGSLDLGNNSNFNHIKNFEQTINRFLEDHEAEICIGGYDETRPFYTSDQYQVEGNSGAEWRTIHLGLDFWTEAETPVFAPLDGIVFSFENNTGDCNYGPTIILEHKISEKLTFYTLYGHLSFLSLEGLEKGMSIKKGQQIASIGAAPINGNWPPHLHFQIILDMLSEKKDFPGVAFPNQKDIWLSICPNPQLFFPNLPLQKKSTDHSIDKILKYRSHILGKSLSISYQKPLHMVRGFGQYLYDTSGRRYLDTVNNVAHVGHEHPQVVRAAYRQGALLNTNTRYLHENIIKFANELLETFPPELSVVHFVNSGSEANELALRMVKACTQQKDMIAVEVGYHGNTGGCIDISSYKFDGKGGNGAPPHTHIIPIPDTFRGLYKDSDAVEKYTKYVEIAIEKIKKEGRNIGGFIAESILSCGGQVMLPDGYLKTIYKMIRAEGGICIADEVQVGFGRTGEKFWAFELQDVIPDIVTMGKPIGNGHPLAAVVTTQKVAETFANGMEYFNTFGGNPVSCAIGREVLNVIKEEKLQKNAKEVGDYLTIHLQKLKERHSIIGDVRGIGFFLGIELVSNRKTLEPAADETNYLANRMRERGILMSTDGPLHNVLKIKPPMCFSFSDADFLIENLDKVLSESFIKKS